MTLSNAGLPPYSIRRLLLSPGTLLPSRLTI
jgi:hypothetical protein